MSGAAGYDERLGAGYAAQRRPDPRIARQVHRALGDARRVLNVGAGAGSYEPTDRDVVAVEPSPVMRAQRPAGAAPCVDAVAEALPFTDGAFDAAMALLTLHHWSDWRAGCAELRRVAPGRRVVLTWDIDAALSFWLIRDYLPAVLDVDRPRFAPIQDQAAAIGATRVEVVPIAGDCTDGFLGAFWRRPERYLDPAVRAGMSVFARADPTLVAAGLAALERDLGDGTWHRRNHDALAADELDLGYRLLVAE